MGNMSTFVFGTATKTLMNYLHKSDKKAAQIKKSENSKLMKKVFKSATSQYLKKASQSKSRQSVQKKKPISYVQKKEQPWYKKVIESSTKKINASKKWASSTLAEGVNGVKHGFNVSKDWTSKKITQGVNGVKYGFNVSKDWTSKKITQGVNGVKHGFNVSKDWTSKKITQGVNGVKYGFNVSKDWASKKITQGVNGVKHGFNASKDWTKEKYNLYAPKVMKAWHDTADWVEPLLDTSDMIKKVTDSLESMNLKKAYDNLDTDSHRRLYRVFINGKKRQLKDLIRRGIRFAKLDTIMTPGKLTAIKDSIKSGLNYSVISAKLALESPTGKFITRYGKMGLNKLDLLSPIYKISQAKTPGEMAKIAIDEYVPKIAGGIVGSYTATALGATGLGAIFAPAAGFGAGLLTEELSKRALDDFQVSSKAENYVNHLFGYDNPKVTKNVGTSSKVNTQTVNKNHKNNPIFMNFPSGAVQISHSKSSNGFDTAVMATEVAQQLATQFRRALENKKSANA